MSLNASLKIFNPLFLFFCELPLAAVDNHVLTSSAGSYGGGGGGGWERDGGGRSPDAENRIMAEQTWW